MPCHFFFCVLTNSGYAVVATFILESEDSASVAEALMTVRRMNPGFNPKSFMIDSLEIEMNAIKESFPGNLIYRYLGLFF
jgi:hypothetical protein